MHPNLCAVSVLGDTVGTGNFDRPGLCARRKWLCLQTEICYWCIARTKHNTVTYSYHDAKCAYDLAELLLLTIGIFYWKLRKIEDNRRKKSLGERGRERVRNASEVVESSRNRFFMFCIMFTCSSVLSLSESFIMCFNVVH